MKIRVNYPVLNAILTDHGADKERVKKLRVRVIEEPHLVPKDRNPAIRALKRFVASARSLLFPRKLGEYLPSENVILIYITRIELALESRDTVLAHECGHFLHLNLKKGMTLEMAIPPDALTNMVDPFEDLGGRLHKEMTAVRFGNALMEDPRWHKVISPDR